MKDQHQGLVQFFVSFIYDVHRVGVINSTLVYLCGGGIGCNVVIRTLNFNIIIADLLVIINTKTQLHTQYKI